MKAAKELLDSIQVRGNVAGIDQDDVTQVWRDNFGEELSHEGFMQLAMHMAEEGNEGTCSLFAIGHSVYHLLTKTEGAVH